MGAVANFLDLREQRTAEPTQAPVLVGVPVHPPAGCKAPLQQPKCRCPVDTEADGCNGGVNAEPLPAPPSTCRHDKGSPQVRGPFHPLVGTV